MSTELFICFIIKKSIHHVEGNHVINHILKGTIIFLSRRWNICNNAMFGSNSHRHSIPLLTSNQPSQVHVGDYLSICIYARLYEQVCVACQIVGHLEFVSKLHQLKRGGNMVARHVNLRVCHY